MLKKRLHLLILLLSIGLLGACTARQPSITTAPQPVVVPPPPVIVSPTPDALYATLEENRMTYQAGIELISAGEEVRGEALLAAAREGLYEGITECSQNTLCDPGRYLTALDTLVREQEISIKQQAFRIEELETSLNEEIEREPGTSTYMSELPAIERRLSQIHGTDLDEVIILNGPVQAALDDWLTWMRPLLLSAHQNYQFLRPQIAPVYEKAGLPEALLFGLLATESGGKVHAYSRAGAAGLLQFMRSTGKRYGLRVEDGFDMRLDPEAAAQASVDYLNDQFKAMNNNLEKALAAYNGGENRVLRLHRKSSGSSFWDSKIYYALPQETRDYVPRLMAAAWLFLHPEEYNLEFPVYETNTTRLVLEQDIALGELAICLGQQQNGLGWFRTLRNLNPRLAPGDRIKAGEGIEFPQILVETYQSHCIAGDLIARAQALHDANYPEEPPMMLYAVRRGDTLGKIASRFSCISIGELAALNRIRAPKYLIRTGQELKIPTCG
jgi:membrane-bound lytic murein transglycosylase D